MLILSRNIGQTIVIDDGKIKVVILGVKGNQVRLGIEAPEEIPVHREEIHLKIQMEDRHGRLQESLRKLKEEMKRDK